MSLINVAPTSKFEDYKERYKEHLIMERRNGIILVRMHTRGGEVKFSLELHTALAQVWEEIGGDHENEVMILTGTGDTWMMEFDKTSFAAVEAEGEMGFKKFSYDTFYHDGTKSVENLIWDVDIPTIAAVNGPGLHTEYALLCDITICTEDTFFFDPHLHAGIPPGDGAFLAFQALLGLKRAAYYIYTCKTIDAKTAYNWGLVNEVVPREKLMDRAWELAEMILHRNTRLTRRMTSQLVKHPWKRLITDEFKLHFAHEMYAIHGNPEKVNRNRDFKDLIPKK
jgi:enoyl-CoA hydratase/carnithine racemase